MPGHRDRRPREHAAEMGRECGIQCGAVSHSTRNRFNRKYAHGALDLEYFFNRTG